MEMRGDLSINQNIPLVLAKCLLQSDLSNKAAVNSIQQVQGHDDSFRLVTGLIRRKQEP
ncbi:hypothetical protein CLV42_11624 [Chitinophaga ginsengisoli]|uniref:Uncharacterized protein n=1 Tax=Chitinophaga ginsengisoli TaxID=363837 RepID=A0A2P8FQN3_9BACT|nr:hypothetical protein CLV42_11624 [Chitinophaga ginsengisoli]